MFITTGRWHRDVIVFILKFHRPNKHTTSLKCVVFNFLPTFLYGSENWTLTALQRRRIEAAEMKLLRLLADYTLRDHKTNDSIRRELQTECILEKIDEYRRNWLLHLQRMPPNRISLQTTRKEDNWKTEETLARAVLTLETERIKGSNP